MKLTHAPCTEIQIRKVFKFMTQHGSINRYQADKLGICHLAARVQNLEERGLVYNYIDENGVSDFHGIKHDKIRRYIISWHSMTPKAVEHFAGWAA